MAKTSAIQRNLKITGDVKKDKQKEKKKWFQD